MALTLKTAPATEPVSVIEALHHLRITTGDDDTYIASLIKAARHDAEKFLRRAIVTQTYELRLDEFPYGDILIPISPVQSVTHIKYYDTDGTLQTWSSDEYSVDIYSTIPRIQPAYGYSWPSTRDMNNAVLIEMVVGFGSASAVPEDIKQAILMMVGEMYESRQESVLGVSVNRAYLTSECLLQKHQLKYLDRDL